MLDVEERELYLDLMQQGASPAEARSELRVRREARLAKQHSEHIRRSTRHRIAASRLIRMRPP